jgi:hypothetical protein
VRRKNRKYYTENDEGGRHKRQESKSESRNERDHVV